MQFFKIIDEQIENFTGSLLICYYVPNLANTIPSFAQHPYRNYCLNDDITCTVTSGSI